MNSESNTIIPTDLRREAFSTASEHRRLQLYILLIFADAAAIFVGYAIIASLYLGTNGVDQGIRIAALVWPLSFLIALYNGSYSLESVTHFWRSIYRPVVAFGLAAGLVLFVLFFSKSTAEMSRVVFASGAVWFVTFVVVSRLAARRVIKLIWGGNISNKLVILDQGPDIEIPDAVVVSAVEADLSPNLSDPLMMDKIGHFVANADRVIVSCPVDRREAWASVFRAAGVQGEVTSSILHRIGATAIYNGGSYSTLVISNGPFGLRSRIVKRAMDLVIAGVAIVAVAPLMLVTAFAIKFEDRGPVFFRQRRIGQGNRFFWVYKFRSMTASMSDSAGSQSASKNDPRITRVGSFIRKTSIDELPQLLNVLRGDMSLVGPRPHPVGSTVGDRLFWEVDGRYWDRHCLKPGLTGLAQVRGYRGATDKEEDLTGRVDFDLEYIRSWSPLRDLIIMLQTATVLAHDRAF